MKKRIFIGTVSSKETNGFPMAFQTGNSSEDGEDYSITTNNMKGDEVPECCLDAKTFSKLCAGLLNAFFNKIDVSNKLAEEVMRMGFDYETSEIPHPDNTLIPFPEEDEKKK